MGFVKCLLKTMKLLLACIKKCSMEEKSHTIKRHLTRIKKGQI